jgi:hypothetical protein
MGGVRYELLKCDDCGKTLGYVHACIKIEKDVFCEECFEKRKTD